MYSQKKKETCRPIEVIIPSLTEKPIPTPEQTPKTNHEKPSKEKIEEILDLLTERIAKGEISEETIYKNKNKAS